MLNSHDVREKYEAALEAQADAEGALDNLRAAAVVLDEPTGPEEAAAVDTVRKARENAERLAGALTAVLQAETAERRRLAAADRDAQNAKTLAVAETMEKAARAFDKAAEGYATAYTRLLEAARGTQTEIARRQDVLRRDLNVPALEGIISSYLYKLSPAGDRRVPGAKLVGLVHNPDLVPSVAEVLASLTTAIRADIGAVCAPVAA